MCTRLRVEQVQDITDEDAFKEGLYRGNNQMLRCAEFSGDDIRWHIRARDAYADIWRELYPRGPNSWEGNPMVVVISFRAQEVQQ